jgi:hypothetical protein
MANRNPAAMAGNSLIAETAAGTLSQCVDVIELLQAVDTGLMRDRSDHGRFLLLNMVSDALAATCDAIERPERRTLQEPKTPQTRMTLGLSVVPAGDAA